ncbi:hypothetical protein LAZ67_8003737 [Cordylochernes scorpioides]|uniref:Septin-type G domain-containing protein n=1 Tax=Cordylochernes scorpioides TaxID=51811 RepID=A0ABY6KTT3_9ARAC|nr:hypothetical protein LAZ67_8003737 [Cordylochernes scorpioides]
MDRLFVDSNDTEVQNPSLKIHENIGLNYVALQIQRKARHRNYFFSILILGSAGLGKSTFINTLFLTKVQNKERLRPIRHTTSIKVSKFCLVERGVRMNIAVYDTPGFGDLIDNSHAIQPLEEELDKHFEEYLKEEMEILRKADIHDKRIHCCIYFISPNSGLKEIDIEAMKRLQDKVNLIPVIAKADTLTQEEKNELKASIKEAIISNGIQIYDFPVYARELKTAKMNLLRSRVPFGIVSSESVISAKPKKYGRRYNWGTVEIENMDHSDVMALKLLVLNSHLGDLIDTTHRVHYQLYRKKRLSSINVDNKLSYLTTNQLQWNFEEEKKLSESYLTEKERKLKRLFEMKIRDKQEKLRKLSDSLTEQSKYAAKILSRERKSLNQKRLFYDREKQTLEKMLHGLQQQQQQTVPQEGEEDRRNKQDSRRLIWKDQIQESAATSTLKETSANTSGTYCGAPLTKPSYNGHTKAKVVSALHERSSSTDTGGISRTTPGESILACLESDKTRLFLMKVAYSLPSSTNRNGRNPRLVQRREYKYQVFPPKRTTILDLLTLVRSFTDDDLSEQLYDIGATGGKANKGVDRAGRKEGNFQGWVLHCLYGNDRPIDIADTDRRRFTHGNIPIRWAAPLTLYAPYSSAGLKGNVTFSQSEDGSTVTISFHLQPSPGTPQRTYAWGIYNYPVFFDTRNPCSSSELGRPIHELSKIHGNIQIPSETPIEFTNSDIKLKGPETIWGMSLLLRSTEAGQDFRACTNIADPGEVRTVEAIFTTPVAGSVILRENERGETTIFSNIFHTAEEYQPSTNHDWKILVTDILESTKKGDLRRCDYLQVLYDPLNRDDTNCSRTDQNNCKIGDLSKKHDQIVVGASNSRYSKKFYVDTNLPLNSLENQRSLYLVLFEKDNPLRIMACAKMFSVKPKEVKAIFNEEGVKGHILFSQRYRMDPTVVTVNIKNLRGRGSEYYVHDFPVPLRYSKDDQLCSIDSIGNIYNPYGVDTSKTSSLEKGTNDQYEIGNLSGKYGKLDEMVLLDFYFGIYADFNLPLFGSYSIVGRSVGIYNKEGRRWICATIGYPASMRTGIATFTYPVVGRVIFRQEEGNPFGETTVYGELSYGDGSVNNTENHRFDVHVNEPGRDFYNWTRRCESAGGDYNPFFVGLGRQYDKYCMPDNPLRCRMGDLTGKFRRIAVANSRGAIRNKFFYTDTNLPLSGHHKILGKSLVVHDDAAPPHRGDRLACTGIRIYHAVRASIRRWESQEKMMASGIVTFAQDFETDPTTGRIELSELQQIANGYHIHELSVPQGKFFPCTEDAVRNHFNPFEVNTSLGPAPKVGSTDQYEVGDLSGKFGMLEGRDMERVAVVDTSLPLHGPHSVVGRSVVVHKKERNARWTCGTILPEYNRAFTREVVAIASFHDPRSFLMGYVRLETSKNKMVWTSRFPYLNGVIGKNKDQQFNTGNTRSPITHTGIYRMAQDRERWRNIIHANQRQLEYSDGGMSDTWMEVDLKYPGKHNSKKVPASL